MDALVGTVLEGAYRITRLIGEGGMGAVYEAVQLRLAKRVAVKLMARHLAADQKALARFHREAEITSRLGHPHLVAVVDYGQAESGEPYLVMEYLEGEDLDHRLRRVGRMPIDAVVRVVRQVASALSAAHTQGIVHRDLKPGNIFLVQIPGEPDFVKVLDFGISKMMAARTRLTNASAAVGTPIYMSPEQATGLVEEVDHHVDQWALACIAWEMLLGHPPFVADDVTALLYQIIKMDPHPLTPRVPGLPPGVELELRQALAKRPADRFPSIREFSHAFETAALGRPADLTPAPVQVLPASLDGPILGYRETQVSATPATPLTDQASRDEGGSEVGPSPDDTESVRIRPWRRIKPIHAIVAAAGVLVLIGAFLIFRSNPTPAPVTGNPGTQVISPVIVAPIEPTPAPPVVAPIPTETNPVAVEPEATHAKRAKATTPAVPAGREKAKQPTAPTSRPKAKRQLIKEL
jgi:serine/threonine-protein kinase